MTQTWINGLKVSFLIIGTTIGAGFASGREIWEFFTSYGKTSSLYILLSMLLFSMSCYIIMTISNRLKAPHYVKVLEELIGKPFARVYDILIFFYLLSTTVVMFAGSGATLAYWSISYWSGVCLIALLVFIVFLRDVEGIISLNSVLIPILIITLLAVCLVFLWGDYGQEFEAESNSQVLSSSIAFTALNILPLIAVLSALGSRMKQAEIKIATGASAIGLACIAFVYNQSLLKISHEIILYEVPLFAILKYLPEKLLIGVTFVLWLAIYTTAVSGVLGMVSRCRELLHTSPWLTTLILIVLMLPLTTFGFSNLIRILYPLYGVLNLFILATILLYPLANKGKMS